MDVIVIELRNEKEETIVTHVASTWEQVEAYMTTEALTYIDSREPHSWWAAMRETVDEICMGPKELRFFDKHGRPRKIQPRTPEIEAHPEWDDQE